jgi:hypothetical protein
LFQKAVPTQDVTNPVKGGQGTALQIGRSLVRFQMVSLGFSIDIILPIALWPWDRLSL